MEHYVSGIGGMLGLWFGCSLFTILEFIVLLMDLMCMRWKRGHTRAIECDVTDLDHRMFYIFKDSEAEKALERRLALTTPTGERPCRFVNIS